MMKSRSILLSSIARFLTAFTVICLGGDRGRCRNGV
jgi:hypothetical protein